MWCSCLQRNVTHLWTRSQFALCYYPCYIAIIWCVFKHLALFTSVTGRHYSHFHYWQQKSLPKLVRPFSFASAHPQFLSIAKTISHLFFGPTFACTVSYAAKSKRSHQTGSFISSLAAVTWLCCYFSYFCEESYITMTSGPCLLSFTDFSTLEHSQWSAFLKHSQMVVENFLSKNQLFSRSILSHTLCIFKMLLNCDYVKSYCCFSW